MPETSITDTFNDTDASLLMIAQAFIDGLPEDDIDECLDLLHRCNSNFLAIRLLERMEVIYLTDAEEQMLADAIKDAKEMTDQLLEAKENLNDESYD